VRRVEDAESGGGVGLWPAWVQMSRCHREDTHQGTQSHGRELWAEQQGFVRTLGEATDMSSVLAGYLAIPRIDKRLES
jgi:hypothetical protein